MLVHKKKNSSEKLMCDKCYIDEVSIHDLPTCFIQSVVDIFYDITNGILNLKSFTKNDRIFYIIFSILIILIVRRILKRNEHKEPYQTFWEMDARWNP